MWRKLFFLTSFVLVLALTGAVQAATDIDVNNYSFEYDSDGNQIDGHQDVGPPWEQGGTSAFIGVDTFCPHAIGHCHNWPASDGYCYMYMENANPEAYQILDPCDANAVIAEGKRYTLTFDALAEGEGDPVPLAGSFFYPEDPCVPDVNHIEVASRTFLLERIGRDMGDCSAPTSIDPIDICREWHYDQKVVFLAPAGYDGNTLGIKFTAISKAGAWSFVDNVRLEWTWGSQAYNPNPEDGAKEVPKDASLIWNPGLWPKDVNGHDVYFGSTWAEVNSATTASSEFQGVQSPNSFDPTPGANILTLGDTYYWRIDEVNENYTPGPVPVPPGGKWKGDVWSFTVAGRAKNPKPPDASSDVPKNVILRWTRGAESLYHDVYFGSTDAEVTAATTSSGEYKTQLNKGTEEYDAGTNEDPEVGEQYFWRIDEVNSITVKGHIWDFTVANWMLVDDFDFYPTPTDLRVVWEDYYTGYSDATIWVNKDANYAVDGNSMMFEYWNNAAPYYSETKRTYSSAQDWSYSGNGVTALELDWFGDVNSAPDPPMYVKLSDGSTTVQVNPDSNNASEESQHTWIIPLSDFNDGGVTLSGITSIILGIGDGKGEGGKPLENGTLYFDDIRLYPPRCMADYTSVADFTKDCVVDYCDVNVMATDWLLADGNIPTETQNGTLTGFVDDDTQWIDGHIDGALEFGGSGYKVHVTDPRLVGITNMSITAWVKQTVDNDYVAIVISREGACGDDPVELGIYGGAYGGPDGLGYDWSCGTEEWKFDAGLDVPEDGTWTFCAVSVDPTGATLYMRPDGCDLSWARNAVAHEPADSLKTYFDIGSNLEGALDDVRIYAYDLDFNDVNDLAFETGEPTPPPVYHYDFNETSGLVAADSGTPVIRYGPVPSKANLTDPEAKFSRSVNFRDYAILANDWLGDFEYPPAP